MKVRKKHDVHTNSFEGLREEGMNIAIIGAAGQVGSVLVRRLSRLHGMQPIAVCRNVISAGIVHFSCPECEIRVGSVSDKDMARKLIGDCDVVINCALAAAPGGPKKSRQANTGILDGFFALEKLQLLIHFSSISVYGDFISDLTASRSTFTNPKPDNEYGRSKLLAERHAKHMCESKGIRHYILRLGHVFGAGTDRSRDILELSGNANFALPFDGHLPSNAVHVERLSSAIIRAIQAPIPEGIYNVAETGATWRKVFDWHTEWCGIPPVKGMPDDLAEQMRSPFLRRSVMNEALRWATHLPFDQFVRSPATFDLALRVLTRAPGGLTRLAANLSRRTGARRHVSAVVNRTYEQVSPVYLSDGMPGTNFPHVGETFDSAPSEEQMRIDLAQWYDRFSGRRLISAVGI